MEVAFIGSEKTKSWMRGLRILQSYSTRWRDPIQTMAERGKTYDNKLMCMYVFHFQYSSCMCVSIGVSVSIGVVLRSVDLFCRLIDSDFVSVSKTKLEDGIK